MADSAFDGNSRRPFGPCTVTVAGAGGLNLTPTPFPGLL